MGLVVAEAGDGKVSALEARLEAETTIAVLEERVATHDDITELHG